MNLSHWELDTYFRNNDVTIIGSGIVGLNAALHLKTAQPKLKILVLERGFLPSGASTKNAGFACFGSVSELLDDLKHHTEEEVFALVERRFKGLKRLRKNLGDKPIDYLGLGGFEVFGKGDEITHLECSSKIEYLNKKLQTITGKRETYLRSDKKIKQLKINDINHIIENTAEGQIDAGKMMFSLTKKVQSLGVNIINGIEIDSFENMAKDVLLKIKNNLEFSTKRLLICTNGFAKQLLPSYPVIPARAQVMITSPIKNLKLKGAFHYNKGFYYFRNIGNRVLIGGGRNLDLTGEETSEFGITEQIQHRLEEMLRTIIIPYAKDYVIENRWSGIMGLGPQKTSIIKKVDGNIFCAVRMGGMGIAIGSLVGEDAAGLVLKSL